MFRGQSVYGPGAELCLYDLYMVSTAHLATHLRVVQGLWLILHNPAVQLGTVSRQQMHGSGTALLSLPSSVRSLFRWISPTRPSLKAQSLPPMLHMLRLDPATKI